MRLVVDKSRKKRIPSSRNCEKIYFNYYIQDNNLDISNLTLNFHTANVVGKENMMCYWANFKDYYEVGNEETNY